MCSPTSSRRRARFGGAILEIPVVDLLQGGEDGRNDSTLLEGHIFLSAPAKRVAITSRDSPARLNRDQSEGLTLGRKASGRVRTLERNDAAACDAIIASLPDWFGIPEGIRDCARDVRAQAGLVFEREEHWSASSPMCSAEWTPDRNTRRRGSFTSPGDSCRRRNSTCTRRTRSSSCPDGSRARILGLPSSIKRLSEPRSRSTSRVRGWMAKARGSWTRSPGPVHAAYL